MSKPLLETTIQALIRQAKETRQVIEDYKDRLKDAEIELCQLDELIVGWSKAGKSRDKA